MSVPAAVAVAALLIAGCGGNDQAATTRTAAPTTAETTTASTPTTGTTGTNPPAATTTAAPIASESFAIGITEDNPHLIAPGAQPPEFAAFRDRLAALKPAYVRVLVDWAHLQPHAGRDPDFAEPADGCMRTGKPCAPFAGLEATLKAIAAQKAQPVFVVYGTPRWAARREPGCERTGTTSRERPPRLAAYRDFVRSLLRLTERLKLERVWWSAWNEPNTPGFLNPQRSGCGDDRAPAVSPGIYVRIARVLAAALRGVPGQEMLLGDAAGVPEGRPKAVGAAEFVRDLPDDLVCGAAAWAQHAHLVRPRGGGKRIDKVPASQTARLLAAVVRALDGHHCSKQMPIWITETGVGNAPHGCAIAGRQLDAWKRGGRVRAAFQYTMREDPVFPVGLTDPELKRLYPAYRAWRARGLSGC